MRIPGLVAVLFDVFGTVVDWRTAMIGEIEALGREKNIALDTEAFIDAWRAAYRKTLADIRAGSAPPRSNRRVYRDGLEALLAENGIDTVTEDEKDHLSRIDQRCRPWPDAIAGIDRLKKRYITGTLSNGTFVALVNMAKNAGLPWDVILTADLLGHRKPAPEAYLNAVRLLDCEPENVMLAAAHNSDLAGARACGLKTGFVCRPTEYGPAQKQDLEPEGPWDVCVNGIDELAAALGA